MGFKETIIRTASMSLLQVKKHSPEILMVTGVAGVVAGTVLLCKASASDEFRDTIDMAKYRCGKAEETLEHKNVKQDGTPYNAEDAQKDKINAIGWAGKQVLKVYWPGLLVETIGITALLASNHILTKRNAAVMMSLASVSEAFRQYRDRVVEAEGTEKDRGYLMGTETVERETTVVDKNGKEKKKIVKGEAYSGTSVYARIFDESNLNYSTSPTQNAMFLHSQERWLNDKLKINGHLFLNDVYRALGFEDTPEGAIAGWIYDPDHKNPHYNGDSYVDFGCFTPREDEDLEEVRQLFLDGREPEVMLDFNVAGPVYQMI